MTLTIEQMRSHYGKMPSWQLWQVLGETDRALNLAGLSPAMLADLFMIRGVIHEHLTLRGDLIPDRGPFYLNGSDGAPSPIDD